MPRIKLNRVHCTLPDEVDKDEMYLRHKGEKIWPKGAIYYSVDTGDVAPVNLIMEVEEGWNEIELWDFDFLSRNDFLGTFRFKVDQTPGYYTNSMHLVEKGSTASYILDWEILKEEPRSFSDNSDKLIEQEVYQQ
ncbi:MAG: hypothetical protein ABJF11_00305 [Reichenbachiella sp.]|uniref:hypothetical protein n=1 Tax=Reichenbachiella sp. TaxID=2184521 RepID=UPI003262DD8F